MVCVMYLLPLAPQIAQSRPCLYTVSPKVGVVYILGAVGKGFLQLLSCCLRF